MVMVAESVRTLKGFLALTQWGGAVVPGWSFGDQNPRLSDSLPSAGRAGEGGGLAERPSLAHRPPSRTLPAEGRELKTFDSGAAIV